jgi:hypothetical protein
VCPADAECPFIPETWWSGQEERDVVPINIDKIFIKDASAPHNGCLIPVSWHSFEKYHGKAKKEGSGGCEKGEPAPEKAGEAVGGDTRVNSELQERNAELEGRLEELKAVHADLTRQLRDLKLSNPLIERIAELSFANRELTNRFEGMQQELANLREAGAHPLEDRRAN